MPPSKPGQNFDSPQYVVGADVPRVRGSLETKYDAVEMHFGLVQVADPDNDDYTITGGAYAVGLPKFFPESNGMKDWEMDLQFDTDPQKRTFDPAKKAYGFVLVHVAGGGYTGWINEVDVKQASS
jgi:hypothetical protein